MTAPADPPRPELDRWLRRRFPGASVSPMTGDASTRRYHRLLLGPRERRVVMDYGAPFEGETDDVRLARMFTAAGLPVASVEEVAPDPGCLILEDLGERTLERAIEDSRLEPTTHDAVTRDRYTRAVLLAGEIASRGTPVLARSDRAAGPALDPERFRFEMGFFLEHYVGGLLDLSLPAELATALDALADLAASGRGVLCHRDYHSRNLMLREDGGLAMVDIQDARWGPDSYDLASLLCDAYVDEPDPLADELIESYRRCLPGLGRADEFRARYEVVAAQRMIKALGTFGYQIRRLGRERYRSSADRTVSRLLRHLPATDEGRKLHRLLLDLGALEPLSPRLP